MDLIELPIGKQAPVDADCIRIEDQTDGSFKLTGSALCTGEQSDESVTLVGDMTFSTADEAQETGLAWAQTIGVEQLYISRGTLEHPLETLEIDLPSEE